MEDADGAERAIGSGNAHNVHHALGRNAYPIRAICADRRLSCVLVSPFMARTLARQLKNIAQIVPRRLWCREVTTAPLSPRERLRQGRSVAVRLRQGVWSGEGNIGDLDWGIWANRLIDPG